MTPQANERKSAGSPVTRDADGGFIVEATHIAPKLGLDPERFMTLLTQGRVVQATERGLDEHAGTWRLTFTWGARRWRLVVDDAGDVLSEDHP